jgi:nicotinamidase/pyrazinamidase
MKTLIVVDAQNDFMPGGSLPVADGDKIIPQINELIKGLGKTLDLVIFTKDWHPAKHCSFKENGGIWPVHCVQNTNGSALHKDLIVKPEDKIILKGTDLTVDSYSAFYDNERKHKTELTDFLKAKDAKGIIICGLATDYCVKFTVMDAISEGFRVALYTMGCRGVNVNPGDTDKAIEQMKTAGAFII